MARHEALEGPLAQIRFDAVGVRDQRESPAAVGGATGIHGKDLGDNTEPIGFDPSPQRGERPSGLLGVTARKRRALGKERELGRRIGDGRSDMFRTAEQPRLARNFHRCSGGRIEAGEHGIGSKSAGGKLVGAPRKGPPFGRTTPWLKIEQDRPYAGQREQNADRENQRPQPSTPPRRHDYRQNDGRNNSRH